MSRRDDARQAAVGVVEQGELVPVDHVERPVRRVELAVQAAVDVAKLDPVDGALAALAAELGRACDVSAARHDPYGVAAAARELRETLVRLGMDPVSREGKGNAELAELLERMGTAQ